MLLCFKLLLEAFPLPFLPFLNISAKMLGRVRLAYTPEGAGLVNQCRCRSIDKVKRISPKEY